MTCTLGPLANERGQYWLSIGTGSCADSSTKQKGKGRYLLRKWVRRSYAQQDAASFAKERATRVRHRDIYDPCAFAGEVLDWRLTAASVTWISLVCGSSVQWLPPFAPSNLTQVWRMCVIVLSPPSFLLSALPPLEATRADNRSANTWYEEYNTKYTGPIPPPPSNSESKPDLHHDIMACALRISLCTPRVVTLHLSSVAHFRYSLDRLR